jgi:hypothetical protein
MLSSATGLYWSAKAGITHQRELRILTHHQLVTSLALLPEAKR